MRKIFDDAWRRQALAGQSEAVLLLADEALSPLFAFCLYRVGQNRHLCEEVVQETLLLALRDLERYEPARSADNIFPWLTGLARNEIRRVLAREKAAVSLEMLWERVDADLCNVFARLEAEEFGIDLLERQETRALVNATMSQLAPQHREALEGKYVDGKSVRELAHGWKTSEKAVESQLTRARESFRATFLSLTRQLAVVRS